MANMNITRCGTIALIITTYLMAGCKIPFRGHSSGQLSTGSYKGGLSPSVNGELSLDDPGTPNLNISSHT